MLRRRHQLRAGGAKKSLRFVSSAASSLARLLEEDTELGPVPASASKAANSIDLARIQCISGPPGCQAELSDRLSAHGLVSLGGGSAYM